MNCTVCQSPKIKKEEDYFSSAPYFSGSEKLYTCEVCNVKYIHPLPSKEKLEEQNEIFWEYQPQSEQNKKFFLKQARSRFELIQRYGSFQTNNSKFLDIGAGHAFIYDLLKNDRVKFEYDVVESDKNLQKFLIDKGINKVYSSINEPQGSYDVIIMAHILEHLDNPLESLQIIVQKLTKNGILFIEVPNQDDLYKNDLGAHLTVFNKDALSNIAEKAGLKIVSNTTIGADIKTLINIRNKKNKKGIVSKIRKILRYYLLKITGQSDNYNKIYQSLNENTDNGRWLRIIGQKM